LKEGSFQPRAIAPAIVSYHCASTAGDQTFSKGIIAIIASEVIMDLTKKTLGRTGLKVTQLGYGAMEIRGSRIWRGRPCDDDQARTILNAVLDGGINFIDTSNDYGTSELYIGRHLAHRRNEFILATKCGCHVQYAGDHDETPHIWTKENLLRNVADSLQKMQVSQIDLLQLHNPDVETVERNKLVEVLHELREMGAVRYIGCSSTLPYLKTFIQWCVFDVFQIPYSALQRQHENWITRAALSGAGVIIRGGVARGEPGGGQGSYERWQVFEKAGLDELREPGESRTAFLLRFTLSHPHCDTTIVGTLSPEHLAGNLQAALKGPLPTSVYEEAKHRLDLAGERPEE
jgi:aryl-alcohol dehydrogenase-like predicted oxidoreductase